MSDALTIAQTGHVGLNVTELERSKRFYQEVFGLELLSESREGARHFASLGEGRRTVLTLWQQSEGRFGKSSPGLHHLSFRVESVEALRDAERRLRAANVPFAYEGIVPHAEGSDSGGLFFEDPDGIRLEIFSPGAGAGREAPVPGAPSCGFF